MTGVLIRRGEEHREKVTMSGHKGRGKTPFEDGAEMEGCSYNPENARMCHLQKLGRGTEGFY